MSRVAVCHPSRKVYRENDANLCRECVQVASSLVDDPLPAMIAGTEQAGGPEVPRQCGKCGGPWDDRGAYLSCIACGGTWHVTSTRTIRPPRTTNLFARAAQALSGRADRKR